MGQVPWPYYRCFYVWNVLQPKYGSNVTGSVVFSEETGLELSNPLYVLGVRKCCVV